MSNLVVLIVSPPLAPLHRAGLLEAAAVAGARDAGVAMAAVTMRAAGHGVSSPALAIAAFSVANNSQSSSY